MGSQNAQFEHYHPSSIKTFGDFYLKTAMAFFMDAGMVAGMVKSGCQMYMS